MPLVVTQLPSVYGKNLSLTGAVYHYAIGLLLGKEGYAVMMHPMIHNLKLMTTI